MSSPKRSSVRHLWHAGAIFSGSGGVLYSPSGGGGVVSPPLPAATVSTMAAAAASPARRDLVGPGSLGDWARNRPLRDTESQCPRPRGQNEDAWSREEAPPTTNPPSPSLRPAPPPEATDKADVDLLPPDTCLDFKMPVELFRNAKAATPGTPESFWNYSLYRGPGDAPGSEAETKVRVHYCKSLQTTERVLQQYFVGEKLLGFDLEWKADATNNHDARSNISLVQLASPSRVALLHLALFPKNSLLVAPSLKQIMEDAEVTKCGVWIKGDSNRIKKYLDIDARGIFELSHLYKLVKHSTDRDYQLVNKKLVSMATQVQEYLRLPLFKGHGVRASDWSRPLQMEQVLYSASDAYAGVQLYAVLDQMRKNLDPIPPLPHHAELNLPIRLADDGVALGMECDAAEEQPRQEHNAGRGPALSSKLLNSVRRSIAVEPDGGDAADSLPPASDGPAAPPPSKGPCKDARVLEAEVWAAQYRIQHPQRPIPVPALRSYRLWHYHQDLTPQDAAKLLRDPPLSSTTVNSYILESIRLGRLPYDASRLKAEVLDQVPHFQKYAALIRECESRYKMA